MHSFFILIEFSSIRSLKEFNSGSYYHFTQWYTLVIDKDINDFIKNEALLYQEKKVANTTIFIYNEDIIGFCSIAADSLKLKVPEKIQHEVDGKPIKEFPAIKIARLGRDKKYKSLKVGEGILKWAFGHILECSDMVAVRFVTLDAYPKRVGYYEDLKFIRNTHESYTGNVQNVSMRFDLFNAIPKK